MMEWWAIEATLINLAGELMINETIYAIKSWQLMIKLVFLLKKATTVLISDRRSNNVKIRYGNQDLIS